MNYYNEFDPFAAAWLRELIADGLIPDGHVDDRSMLEVKPNDLTGYTQCHFFAGIGGWSRALELSGWSADRPVWTGSPPCQPFSVAGKQKGKDDERHLWPAFFDLIRECQPPTVFGEQVASAIRDEWFDDLQADMEGEGYATGMVVLPACSVGAPHKRDRLFYVADRVADASGKQEYKKQPRPLQAERERCADQSCRCGLVNSSGRDSTRKSMADTKREGLQGRSSTLSREQREDGQTVSLSVPVRVADTGSAGREGCERVGQTGAQGSPGRHAAERSGDSSTVVNSDSDRCEARSETAKAARQRNTNDAASWIDSELIYCRDGKHRPIPVEPALFPLADGISNRVGLLRGAGNAIVPQAAAEVIKAFIAAED